MMQQENTLDLKPTGAPKMFRGPFSINGWKRFSYDVFNGRTESVGRLDVMLSQHRRNATSVQFYLFDSNDSSRIKVFNAPVLHPPDSKEELFERARKYAHRCFKKRDNEESVPIEQTDFSR